GPVDWDCNGFIDGAPVAVDINGDGVQTNLPGQDDWANLDFYGGVLGYAIGGKLAPPSVVQMPPEPDAETLRKSAAVLSEDSIPTPLSIDRARRADGSVLRT